ncbi:MAG TPA: bifunctional diguanylate cyclase/phosphodiesterase [Steroidobacteraceae bacterium]|nr:bifunctional diguanylate cyclase/phosphodiesterase [Steroidobacteraceae bacterium]
MTDPPPLMSFDISMDPYAQLVRSLLPRAASVSLFDNTGKLLWSSAQATNPDLFALVLQGIAQVETDRDGVGQHCALPDEGPAYLFWLRDPRGALSAVVAVICTRRPGDADPLPFSYVHEHLKPALELLRRDLLARADIDQLNESLTARDKDLELLLSVTGSHPTTTGSDDLLSLLANAASHLKCVLAGIVVPDKGLRLTHPDNGDASILTRTQRQLLAITQTRRDPLVINKIATQAGQVAIPYRILACPLRQGSGRTSGVLALFRKLEAPEFVGRDVHLADLVAHKIAASIETSYDTMSGLLTRAALEQRVRLMYNDAGARLQRWSLLYVDIDELHVINENFGMHVGDQAIGQIGDLLRKHLPPNSVAARISGDRFAVVMMSEMDEAAMFGEGLREGVTRLATAHVDARFRLSISLGVTPFSGRDSDLGRSLAEAESACKAAKDRGRNRLETFQENDVSIIRRFTDINVATDVRSALAENRLRLEAQMILPFVNGPHSKPHYELLLRMLDPDGNTIGPDRFLSAALRYQMMPTIDRWVIASVIDLLRPRRELLANAPVSFTINFSGQSLHDDEFADYVIRSIETSRINPAVFCFELTESAAVASMKDAEALMQRLRKLGCGVALDDFGTGLSSLSYLRSMPVSMLKIDGSFVRDILRDERAESMVRAIAQLARAMNITTVAEYVETEEIRTRVRSLGVDYGQGFAIARPVPVLEVLEGLPMLAAATTGRFLTDEATRETG